MYHKSLFQQHGVGGNLLEKEINRKYIKYIKYIIYITFKIICIFADNKPACALECFALSGWER